MDLASNDVAYEEFTSKISLLDWDVIFIRPNIQAVLFASEMYNGKPLLNERSSFKIKESCEHWYREIKDAVDSGKFVIAYLSKLEEFYIYTGRQEFSGTGRSQKTTNIVQIYNNYKCLPVSNEFIASSGSSMSISKDYYNVLDEYWSKFSKNSIYNSYSKIPSGQTCIITKDGDRSVGQLITSKKSSGALLLLPDISDFDRSDFYIDEEDENFKGDPYSDEAKEFSVNLITEILNLRRKLNASNEKTIEPSWVNVIEYELVKEKEIQQKLLKVEEELHNLNENKNLLKESLNEETQIRGLLYESGKSLEAIIHKALKILGFETAQYADGKSEFDVVFESEDGRLLGEVEGKDNKPINIEKLRQLSMNIHEDLERDCVSIAAKGILFGNGYRVKPIQERAEQFTEKCITNAKSLSFGLVATSDLFLACRYILNSNDQEYAADCRRILLDGVGVIKFPAHHDTPSINLPVKLEPSELGDIY